MTRQNFFFTLFLSLAAAAAGGLYASTQGTAFENAIIGAGLTAIIVFAFLAGMMQATISKQQDRQRQVARAERIVRQEQGNYDNSR